MFAAMNPNLTPISRDHHKKIVKMIQTLLAYEQSNVFRKPIPHKSLGWEDYRDVVKKPIDLNYVRRQNSENKYKFLEQVLDEIQLIWDNVFIYGKRDHESYEMALKMVKHFDEVIKDLFPQYYDKISRVSYFKQFEPVKTEKKSSNVSNDKNLKKAEKMDIENVKEQAKVQKNIRGAISSRRRDQIIHQKQQNEKQSIPIPSTNLLNVDESKKKVQSKERIIENKKIPHKSQEIQIQESLIAAQNQKIDFVGTIKVPEHKQLENNQKQLQMTEPVVAIQHTAILQLPNGSQTPQQQHSFQQQIQSLDGEDSQQNNFPPIIVKLNKTPSSEEVSEITQMMRLFVQLQDMETISKIVKILTKYEKQHMIIDGQDVNFRMNQIHISTYSRIRKELQDKIKHFQHSEKFKDLNRLKEKFNINLVNEIHDKTNQKSQGSKIIEQN